MRTSLTYLGKTGTTSPPSDDLHTSVSGAQTIVMDTPNERHFDHAVGFSIPIEKPKTTLGRSNENDICLNKCPAVSGKHGIFLLDGKNLHYEDISRNGTFIDGSIRKQGTCLLSNDSVISFPADKYTPESQSTDAWLHFKVRIEGASTDETCYDEGPTTEVGSKEK